MQNFKKILRTTGLFLLIVCLISGPLITLFLYSENHLYQDYREREEFAGSLDYLIAGASHAERGMIPEILDQELGVNSYNLAYSLMTMQGRLEILKKEIARNPVKTVILEVSLDTMTNNPDTTAQEGDMYMVARLRSASYLLRAIRPWHYGWMYYQMLHRGVKSLKLLVTGQYRVRNINQLKGFVPHANEERTLKKKNIKKIYHTQERNTEIWPGNEKYLQEIIELCKEKGIRLILLTIPIPRYTTARYSNLNVSYSYYRKVAEENGLPFYDFNLLKEKNTLLPDRIAFTDQFHLSNAGADTFTRKFCECMKAADAGEDLSGLFFEDYIEMDANEDYSIRY